MCIRMIPGAILAKVERKGPSNSPSAESCSPSPETRLVQLEYYFVLHLDFAAAWYLSRFKIHLPDWYCQTGVNLDDDGPVQNSMTHSHLYRLTSDLAPIFHTPCPLASHRETRTAMQEHCQTCCNPYNILSRWLLL